MDNEQTKQDLAAELIDRNVKLGLSVIKINLEAFNDNDTVFGTHVKLQEKLKNYIKDYVQEQSPSQRDFPDDEESEEEVAEKKPVPPNTKFPRYEKSLATNTTEKEQIKQKLLDYYDITISGINNFYPGVFWNWIEGSWVEYPSMVFDQSAVNKWVDEPFNYTQRKANFELQPHDFGDPDPWIYKKEIIDVNNRRMLYMSTSDRGGSKTFNVFISAPVQKMEQISLLMNAIFLCPLDQVGELIKTGNVTDAKHRRDIAHISIHPFKLNKEDASTIGILFTYKE